MTLRTYSYWKANGEPYRLSRPVQKLVDRLRGYGYTVYHYPDISHLTASPPEDHDPFSATGYPVESAFGVGHAADIMPPPAGGDLPTDRQLGEQMYLDRQAGVPGAMWIKYINHTDSAGACWHDKWQPDHVRTTSSDVGHTHTSAYSNMDDSTIGDDYDPVARFRERVSMTAGDETVAGLTRAIDFQSEGIRKSATAAGWGRIATRTMLEYVWGEIVFGGLVGRITAALLGTEFVDKLATAVAAKLVVPAPSVPPTGVTPEQLAAALEAFAAKLREKA